MAALIRFTRYLPVFRNLSLNHGIICNEIISTGPRCTTAIQNVILKKQTRSITRTSSVLQMSPSLVEIARPSPTSPAERFLMNIENDINRFHQVNEDRFNYFISIMDTAEPLTSLQANLVLRCTGSLLHDMLPHQRRTLPDEIWAKLEKAGVPLVLGHYNTLLRVYLENEQSFSPTEFLGRMEDHDIKANRVTYQHLIARYCATGDIEGASGILEHMKSLELPITEQIFNSLITGHFKANDEAGALSTLTLMKESGLVPSHLTYGTIALQYSEKGNIEEMKKIMQEAEIVGATVKPYQLLQIVFSLATNGQSEQIPEMLYIMKGMGMFYQGETKKCVHNLIFEGHHDVAYQVFLTMHSSARLEDESSFGRFFIRALVKNETPLDKVFEIAGDMSEKGCNRDGLLSIPHIALLMEKTEYALAALDRLTSEGQPLRFHYMWPAICQFRKRQDKDGIYSIVDKIQTLPEHKKIDLERTVHGYVIPSLQAIGESAESTNAELQKHGLSSDVVTFGIFISLFRQQGIKPALEFVGGKTMKVAPSVLKVALIDYLFQSKDWESIVQVLATCENISDMKELIEVTGDLLLKICIANRNNLEELEHILDRFTEQNLKIFERQEKMINSNLEELPDTVLKKLHGLVTSEEFRPTSIPVVGQLLFEDATNLSDTDLEKMAAENPKNFSLKKKLLSRYCYSGKVEEAENLMVELDSVGFVYQGMILRQLVFLNAFHKQDLEKARMYLEKLENEYPEYDNYIKAMLSTAILIVQNGSIQDGLECLNKYRAKHENFMLKNNFSEGYVNGDICCKLTAMASKVGNPDEAMEMVDTIFDLGYVKKASYSVLQDYMQGFIDKGDISECLQAFSLIIKKFHRTCKVSELFILCMNQKDAESLQKVLDSAISIHGEMNILNQLICSFVECGQIEKAKKVLETPGIRAMMTQIKDASDKFIANNMVTEMENLVTVTKDMFGIDREEMLFQLIRLKTKVGKFTEVADMTTRFEEEDIQPKARTLRYLGKVLQSQEMEVPFEIPSTYQEMWVPVKITLGTMEDLVTEAVKKNIGHTFKIKDKLDTQEKSEENLSSSQFISNVASSLLGNGKMRDFNHIISRLAINGDVESLLFMKGQEQFSAQLVWIKRKLFVAFVNSNRVDEILALLQEHPGDASDYVHLFGIRCLKQKSPESLENLETVACQLADEGHLKPLNNMWMYYFLEEPEKADILLQRYPTVLKTLRVIEVCYSARNSGKQDTFQKLIELLRGHNEDSLLTVYSYLIEHHCIKNDADAAVVTLEQMRGDGVKLEDINEKVAIKLEKLLQEHKQMPAGVLDKTVADSKQDDSDSDSSSSSSSDSDRGK